MTPGNILAIMILMLLFFFGIVITFIINMFFAPTYNTPQNIVEEILKIMKLKEGDTFVDLGSGDGRVVLTAAKDIKLTALGYEISPIMLMIGSVRKLFTKRKGNVQVEVDSIFHGDITKATHIFAHLDGRTIEALESNLDQRITKGAYLFSYEYPLKRKHTRKYKLSNGVELFRYKL